MWIRYKLGVKGPEEGASYAILVIVTFNHFGGRATQVRGSWQACNLGVEHGSDVPGRIHVPVPGFAALGTVAHARCLVHLQLATARVALLRGKVLVNQHDAVCGRKTATDPLAHRGAVPVAGLALPAKVIPPKRNDVLLTDVFAWQVRLAEKVQDHL